MEILINALFGITGYLVIGCGLYCIFMIGSGICNRQSSARSIKEMWSAFIFMWPILLFLLLWDLTINKLFRFLLETYEKKTENMDINQTLWSIGYRIRLFFKARIK